MRLSDEGIILAFMIFSCTKKVLDKVKKHRPIEAEKIDIGLHNWYVDLLVLDRKQYFLFTHSQSLFCFFFYVGTKTQILDLETLFKEAIKSCMQRTYPNRGTDYISFLFSEYSATRFLKTNSRVVTGCMNDFKFQIRVLYDQDRALTRSHDRIEDSLNGCPMSSIRYKFPREEMKELLEKELM